MRRLTLVFDHQVQGVPLRELPFRDLQQQVNKAIPAARWAYFGYVGNRFCMDTVVTEGRRDEVMRQAGRLEYVARVLDDPWPEREH